MGLFKLLKMISDSDREENERDIDKYDLSKEEKQQIKKGYYQPDEFDCDDDEDNDEDL